MLCRCVNCLNRPQESGQYDLAAAQATQQAEDSLNAGFAFLKQGNHPGIAQERADQRQHSPSQATADAEAGPRVVNGHHPNFNELLKPLRGIPAFEVQLQRRATSQPPSDESTPEPPGSARPTPHRPQPARQADGIAIPQGGQHPQQEACGSMQPHPQPPERHGSRVSHQHLKDAQLLHPLPSSFQILPPNDQAPSIPQGSIRPPPARVQSVAPFTVFAVPSELSLRPAAPALVKPEHPAELQTDKQMRHSAQADLADRTASAGKQADRRSPEEQPAEQDLPQVPQPSSHAEHEYPSASPNKQRMGQEQVWQVGLMEHLYATILRLLVARVWNEFREQQLTFV